MTSFSTTLSMTTTFILFAFLFFTPSNIPMVRTVRILEKLVAATCFADIEVPHIVVAISQRRRERINRDLEHGIGNAVTIWRQSAFV